MPQQTFAEITFKQYRKPTRWERFLDEMNRVPRADLVAASEPVYPKAEGLGRPPVDVERMLRFHCLQQWFNLSDPAVDEALYDSRAMRQFVGIDLGPRARTHHHQCPSSTKNRTRSGIRRGISEKGELVVLRHESPYWGRQPHQTDSFGGGHGGPCA